MKADTPGKPLIRNAQASDVEDIRRIAEATGMFLGEELDGFLSEINAYFRAFGAGDESQATLIVAAESGAPDARVLGAAYFTPEIMAQGVMNLLFIGVAPEARKTGLGRALLNQFEAVSKTMRARLAVIETASDAMFRPAWSLYRSAGYDEEARVRDYYDDGLDKIIFRKRL